MVSEQEAGRWGRWIAAFGLLFTGVNALIAYGTYRINLTKFDCTPGKHEDCRCDDGNPSQQVCAVDGKSFGACMCDKLSETVRIKVLSSKEFGGDQCLENIDGRVRCPQVPTCRVLTDDLTEQAAGLAKFPRGAGDTPVVNTTLEPFDNLDFTQCVPRNLRSLFCFVIDSGDGEYCYSTLHSCKQSEEIAKANVVTYGKVWVSCTPHWLP